MKSSILTKMFRGPYLPARRVGIILCLVGCPAFLLSWVCPVPYMAPIGLLLGALGGGLAYNPFLVCEEIEGAGSRKK